MIVEKKIILENTPQLSQYRKKLGDAEKETTLSVFTTWELSFQQLQTQCTEDGIEIKFLTLFAFFHNKDISEEFFAGYDSTSQSVSTSKLFKWLKSFTDDEKSQWDIEVFQDVLIKLRDLSLIQPFTRGSDGFHHLSLHPLIKDWIQLRIVPADFQENSLMATVLVYQRLKKCYRDGIFDLSLLTRQSLIPHILCQEENCHTQMRLQYTVPLSQGCREERLFAQEYLTSFLLEAGLYVNAEMMEQRRMAEAKIVLGPEHPNTLDIMTNLALIYAKRKMWKQAEELNVQAMETSSRVLGKEHLATVWSS